MFKHCLNFPEINTFCVPPPYYKWDKRKKVLNNNSTEYLKIIQSSKNPFNFGANPGPDPDDEHFLKTKSVFFLQTQNFHFFLLFRLYLC